MKSRRPELTVNEQIEHLRKQVLGLIAFGFLVIIISGFFVVRYYQGVEHDLHFGSCTGRLSFIRTLKHAEAVTLRNPAITQEQRARTVEFYKETIPLTDVSDCGDVHLPPPPPISG